MTRLEQILVGAYRDLQHWQSQPRVRVEGADAFRNQLAANNVHVDYAMRDVVRLDTAKWLGRPLRSGDPSCNTRTFNELGACGLAIPVRSVGCGARARTVALHITEAGKAKAAALLTKSPASAGNLTPAEPALATSQTLEN